MAVEPQGPEPPRPGVESQEVAQPAPPTAAQPAGATGVAAPTPPASAPTRQRRRWPWLLTGFLTGALLFGLGGFVLGALAQYNATPEVSNFLTPLFGTATTTNLDTASLEQIWQVIRHQYVRTNPSQDAAFDGAAKGLVGSLNTQFGDAFSAYLTPAELQRNREFLNGSFGGIGATMGTDTKTQRLMVSSVLPQTPAQKAGLTAGDIVLKIDGQDTAGMNVDTAVNKIRGPVGTPVRLTLDRGGRTLDVTITRETITVPSVLSKTIRKGVLYVRITDFGAQTANDFEQALQGGINAGDNRVILDLRQNPGGYVNAADSVISEFVKSGKTVTLIGRDGSKEEHDVTGHGVAFTPKLVVLIDELSASASEIVAGALKDNHRATLVGEKTFGKGSVQEDFNLRNGGDLHLTIAYWYTPSGVSIEKNGITPDKTVALPQASDRYEVDNAQSNPASDTQLQAALALLG